MRRGFEARCVGVRRNTDEAKGGYSRAAGGGGEMERSEERGEKVYRM